MSAAPNAAATDAKDLQLEIHKRKSVTSDQTSWPVNVGPSDQKSQISNREPAVLDHEAQILNLNPQYIKFGEYHFQRSKIIKVEIVKAVIGCFCRRVFDLQITYDQERVVSHPPLYVAIGSVHVPFGNSEDVLPTTVYHFNYDREEDATRAQQSLLNFMRGLKPE
jgi:hypothetical protein